MYVFRNRWLHIILFRNKIKIVKKRAYKKKSALFGRHEKLIRSRHVGVLSDTVFGLLQHSDYKEISSLFKGVKKKTIITIKIIMFLIFFNKVAYVHYSHAFASRSARRRVHDNNYLCTV